MSRGCEQGNSELGSRNGWYNRVLMRLGLPLLVSTLVLGCAEPARELLPGPTEPLLFPGPLSSRSVQYTLRARLVPAAREVRGVADIRLRNTARVAVREVRLHLYLNAFAGPETLFMKSSRGRLRVSSADPSQPGWIRVGTVRGAGGDLKHELLEDRTVMQVRLPRPLAPGAHARLTIPFTSRLPRVFARTGHADEFFMVAQWYPKVGMLRRDGTWDCRPFHAHEEFFGPFGVYRLTLEAPARYRVGATGVLLGSEQRGSARVHRFLAEDVHDFALAAWPHFTERWSRQGRVRLRLLSVPGREALGSRLLDEAERSLDWLQRRLSPYPYSQITLVDVPTAALGAAAMEYPTLFTTWMPWGLPRGVRVGEHIVVHELVHQYFQGMVASNEVEHPWLDEGVASYVTGLIMDELHGADRTIVDLAGVGWGTLDKERLRVAGRRSWPVAWPAREYPSWGTYGRTVYARAYLLLRTVESMVGRTRMIAILNGYVRRSSFKHPGAKDLQRAMVAGTPAHLQPTVRGLLQTVLHKKGEARWDVRCEADRVIVHRRGVVRLPLVVTTVASDGTARRLRWKGKEPSITLPSPGLASARLGPPGRLGLDTKPALHACRVGTGAGAASLRLATTFQLVLQVLGP